MKGAYKMKTLWAIFAMLVLASCTLQTERRGYVFAEDFESELENIKTTKDLEHVMGSPITKTIFGDMVWIYYGTNENYRGPFPATYSDKTALLVWSDAEGKITQKQILKDDDFPEFWMAKGETPIPATIELNAMQELFNNIGRFTPAGLGQ